MNIVKKLIVGGLLTAAVITFIVYIIIYMFLLPPWATISNKTLEKMIIDIKSDYYSRLEKMRAQIRTPRKITHDTPENGNAWDYYRKAIERFKEITGEEKNVFDTLYSEPRKDGTPELTVEEFVEKFNKMTDAERDTYCKQSNTLEEIRKKETPEEKDVRHKKAIEIVEKYKDVFELIHKGTLQTTADMGIKYEDGVAVQIPETSSVLGISKFILEAANILESKGEKDKAIELCLDGIRFGQDLIQGELIGNLVSIADTKIQVSGLSGLLNKGTVDKAMLNKLYNETGVLLESQPSIVDVMNDEMVYAEAELVKIVDDPQYTPDISPDTSDIHPSKRTLKKIFADYISDYTELVSKLQNQLHNYASFKQTCKIGVDRVVERKNIGCLLLTDLEGVFSKILESNSSLQELKIATALKLYSQDNGRVPNQLSELVSSGYMNNLPSDPFTNEPFKYSISNDGKEVTIYSVGKNLRDDGGKGGKYEEDDITFILKLY